MQANETSGQESGGRTGPQPAHRNELAAAADEQTLKRARWEHLRLAAVPGAGRVNVCNVSYGVDAKLDHTYTVTVDRGEPIDCTCPAAEYQPGPCKHVVAVGDAPAVIAAAAGGDGSEAAAATPAEDEDQDEERPVVERGPIMADGGEPDARESAEEACDRCDVPAAEVWAADRSVVRTTGGETLCPDCADARGAESGTVVGRSTVRPDGDDAGDDGGDPADRENPLL
jgi:hypothetical protein